MTRNRCIHSVLCLGAVLLSVMLLTVLPARASDAEAAGETQPSETEYQVPQPTITDDDVVSTDEILLYSGAAVVMDRDTGAVLYEKNRRDLHYPASTTKVLTTLMALERCSLDERVYFSDAAIDSISWDSSNMGLSYGNSLTLQDTLYGVMLWSANEAAYGVGEHVSGSVEQFAEDMNAWCRRIGAVHTHFTNASGWHDDDHYTTAGDLAKIACRAFQNDTFCEISGTIFYTIEDMEYKTRVKRGEPGKDKNGKEIPGEPETDAEGNEIIEPEPVDLYNHHKMVNNEYPYEGILGGKTGYTDMARNTLVTAACRDGHTLICVVMDCPGGKTEDKKIFSYRDTEEALNYSFAHYDSLMADWNARQEALDYIPMYIKNWYEPAAPLSADRMFFPYMRQGWRVYHAYQDLLADRAEAERIRLEEEKTRDMLNEAIREKSVSEFVAYVKREPDKTKLVLIAIVFFSVVILSLIMLAGLMRWIRRKIRWARYKKMRRKRINEARQGRDQ